ncbi:hypothetical protein N8I77_013436 [Diaporthe amygdali]|uniref:Zn(2)-C6 fungal-type domain-containing protein n=1 Tax=Phomopsis amygdali TaxID=1214568 RepID=A0AAD9S1H1_PHOAM|nr:hypothetical protein N8I77_013436 [Diaporthe amygdali]
MKAAQGCWTCKKRKIGCDRSIPYCNNCSRTKRQCGGYGIRLNWPDQLSNRRKDFVVCSVAGLASVERYPQSRERRYLNFTSRDFCLAEKRLAETHLPWHPFMERISARPSLALSPHTPVVGEDAMLLTYYEQIIAPMCSTTRALNGFRHHILSIALSRRDRSTRALCRSMLAIAAHHRQRPRAALAHKTGAMKALYESLAAPTDDGSVLGAEAQLATSMMLCMYDIVGLLGCSIEVFESISSINQMRTMILDPDAEHHVPDKTFEQRAAVEQKLQIAWQQLSPDEVATSTDAQMKAALATAELYRLASLLYLQRVVPDIGDEVRRAAYLRQAFAALNDVPVATGPWPVFIVACEARTDEERIYILEILDQMDKVRNVGNVRVMRTILETIWKQQDLREHSGMTEMKQWWLCADSSVAVPWFV